jgi:hypothetical protein
VSRQALTWIGISARGGVELGREFASLSFVTLEDGRHPFPIDIGLGGPIFAENCVCQKSCRPCENGGGSRIAGGVVVGMPGVLHFAPESAQGLA